jgi:archaellum component FlaF (FlaF/FlaG flagellin family)
MGDNRYNNWWAHFLDGFSLSGAIILIFASLIFIGVYTKQDKVWNTFATALTTFVSAKKVSDYEVAKEKRKTVKTADAVVAKAAAAVTAATLLDDNTQQVK